MSLFHIHKWSPWSGVMLVEGKLYQHRWCLKCRKASIKELGT